MPRKNESSITDTGTRAQILSCAARMFRTQGYAAVSLRNIAKGVGMTTGSLYYHFASKEEIVTEILDQGHRRVLAEVQKSVNTLGQDASGRVVLKTAILRHIQCLLGEDSFPSANIRIFAHVPAEIRMASLRFRHEYEIYWMRLLTKYVTPRKGEKELNPSVLAFLLFGAMNWTLEWYKPGRHDIEDVAETLTCLLFERSLSEVALGTRQMRAPPGEYVDPNDENSLLLADEVNDGGCSESKNSL
jgi:AcrR family transcriptional regulator